MEQRARVRGPSPDRAGNQEQRRVVAMTAAGTARRSKGNDAGACITPHRLSRNSPGGFRRKVRRPAPTRLSSSWKIAPKCARTEVPPPGSPDDISRQSANPRASGAVRKIRTLSSRSFLTGVTARQGHGSERLCRRNQPISTSGITPSAASVELQARSVSASCKSRSSLIYGLRDGDVAKAPSDGSHRHDTAAELNAKQNAIAPCS